MAYGCYLPSALLSILPVALTLNLAYLSRVATAQGTLKANIPPEVTLCRPVNLTWSGGLPPYRLDAEPVVNGSQDTSANQREIGIQTTWFLWTPDFPPGSTLLVTVYPSGTGSPSSGGFTNVLPSSDSSCLPVSTASMATSSTTPSASTVSPSHTNGPLIPADEPSPTSSSSPAVLASNRRRLSKGAIAGIAVAASLVGIGLIALAAWYLLRNRKRVPQPEKGYDRSIVSPALSDDAPTILYTGLSSTLASTDPHKLDPPTGPPAAVLPNSSDALDLRPTPYIISPESTASLSKSRGAGGRKHIREISNESGTNMSTSDVRATTLSPRSQLSTADARDGNGDNGDVGRNALRFDADGTARLSAVGGNLGLGLADSQDVGTSSEVASNSESGEATLPPPYTQVLFQGRAE